MRKLLKVIRLFSNAGKLLSENQPLILASSTAFFTIFSIPPIIIIIANAMGLYFQNRTVSSKFYTSILDIFGEKAATQMVLISENFSNLASDPWITVAGSVFLLFVATNLFNIIRLSINQIWNIRLTSQVNFILNLKNRAIALGIILLTSILFLLSTLSDTLISVAEQTISENFIEVNHLLILIVSKLISIGFITLWLIAVFRYLPDAKSPWKATAVGAAVTAVLFTIGKYLLEKFLIKSNIDNIFETSTSVVIIMLFIFYVSLIVYYGACFTYVYVQSINDEIAPRKNAERYETKSVSI